MSGETEYDGVSKQDLINLGQDVTNIGKVANDLGTVTMREGAETKTVRQVISDAQAAIAATGLTDRSVEEKSANYTVIPTDRGKLILSTAAITLSFPPAATLGNGWFISLKAVTGTLTLDPDGSETIDGAATLEIAEGNSVRITCDGVSFYAQYVSTDGTFNLSDDTSPELSAPLKTNGHAIDFSQGTDIATAAELVVPRDGNIFNLTGTTAVTSIDTTADAWPVGSVVQFRSVASFTLTHHASNLVLFTGADITTQAGDVFIMQKYATGQWRMLSYHRKSGQSLTGGGGSGGSVQELIMPPVASVTLTGVGNVTWFDTPIAQSITLTNAAHSANLDGTINYAIDHLAGVNQPLYFRLIRRVSGQSDVQLGNGIAGGALGSSSENDIRSATFSRKDTPNTASQITYLIQTKYQASSGRVFLGQNRNDEFSLDCTLHLNEVTS